MASSMSRPSSFTSADDNARDVTGSSRKHDKGANSSTTENNGLSLSAGPEQIREEERSEKTIPKQPDKSKGRRRKSEKDGKGSESGRKTIKPGQRAGSSNFKEIPEVSEVGCHSKSETGKTGSRSDLSKGGKRKQNKRSSPEDSKLSVKDRVKSIEMFARAIPFNEEESDEDEERGGEEEEGEEKNEEEVSGVESGRLEDIKDDERIDNFIEEDSYHPEAASDAVSKLSAKGEQEVTGCDIHGCSESGANDKPAENQDRPETKEPRRRLPKTPVEADVIVHSTNQPNEESNQLEWSEAVVRELRGQMPSDSSSFRSETVSSLNDVAFIAGPSGSQNPPNRPKSQDLSEQPRGTVSYLYHDPEAALRLQYKPKKQNEGNLRQGVKKTTDGLALVTQTVMDWVRRKDGPSQLAQEKPWLVKDKGASKADLMAKYKFFSSARLRYKARNMIGATGSRHLNQRRRASIASGTTLPMSLVPSLGQVSESDESRMANVPRRRVVDTSDLRTCAILQSRLKELKTYPDGESEEGRSLFHLPSVPTQEVPRGPGVLGANARGFPKKRTIPQ